MGRKKIHENASARVKARVERIKNAGGIRLDLMLSPEAAKHLKTVKTLKKVRTNRQAVELALSELSKTEKTP